MRTTALTAVTVSTNGKERMVPLRQLIYFTGHNTEQCLLHTIAGDFVVDEPLPQLAQLLAHDFLYCLPKGLVNMAFISALHPESVQLRNGETLAVDAYFMEQLQPLFFRWLGQKAWSIAP